MRETGMGTFAQRIVSVTIKWTTRFLKESLGLPHVSLPRFSFLNQATQVCLVFFLTDLPSPYRVGVYGFAYDGSAKTRLCGGDGVTGVLLNQR
jgi:hypothetical protein